MNHGNRPFLRPRVRPESPTTPRRPEHMSVGTGEDSTGDDGRQQTHCRVFLALTRAQVVTVSITGALVWGITGPAAQVCVFGDVSKVDATERVNTIWFSSDTGSGPKCCTSSRTHIHLLPQRFQRLNMRTASNGGERKPSCPSSPSRGVGKDQKPSWFLINANYVGAVINLATPVLADENKTITFSLCECQRHH